MKTVWLIELKGTLPVLYYRGVRVPYNGTYLFTVDANDAAQYANEKEAQAAVNSPGHKVISNMLEAVEPGWIWRLKMGNRRRNEKS